MGTGASTPSEGGQNNHTNGDGKPVATTKPLGNTEINDQKTHLVRTNQVAPIIIKNCKEEFQHVSEINEPIVFGQIAENMPEHALIKGMYFMVRDVNSNMDRLGTMSKHLAPNLRRCKGNFPIYGLGQPTKDGLQNLMHTLSKENHSNIFLINLREEPVLFAQVDYDMVPYSPRHQDNLNECILKTSTMNFETAEYECDIRKEIIEISHFKDDQKFYFYDDIEKFDGEPHMYRMAYEDFLAVSEETYSRLTFNNSQIKYLRLCMPQEGPVSEEHIDQFLELYKHMFDCGKKSSNIPCCVFTSHTGESRATYGMVMGSLVTAHKAGFPSEANKAPLAINEKSPNYERGEFQIIQELIKLFPDGPKIKHQVDVIIDQCGELLNLRTAITESKTNLEAIKDDYILEGESAKTYFLTKCLKSLARYYFLICFNAYLHEQTAVMYSVPFSKWMRNHAELYYLLSTINRTERSTKSHLLEEGLRFMVADDHLGSDVLSSQMDVKTSNFRRVPGLPVYGMAQPSREGLSGVVNHLLNHKQGHPSVIWFNLRDDLVVECNGTTYSIREANVLEEPLVMGGISTDGIQDKEDELKDIIKKKETFQVYEETDQTPVQKEFNSVLTCLDLVDSQCLQTKQLHYYRIPMSDDTAPPEKFFDQIVTVINNLEDIYNDEDGPALVFQCRTGKGRTTTAMAIAGLLVCHKRGFPYGTKPGEEERVSLPNAKYTQGHYKIVQEVVRRIPHGQQVKREVDFVLNQCSDTMTPMHYHIREVIFVTYNKAKKAKTEEDRQFWKRRSVDYLERYIYLIMFNAYLHCERRNRWKVPFSCWMKDVAAEAGMYEILANISFQDFEEKPDPTLKYQRLLNCRYKQLPIRGTIV